MPAEYRIPTGDDPIVVHFSGIVDDDEFLEVYRSLYDDPAYRLGTDEIADLREVEKFDISRGALIRVFGWVDDLYRGSGLGFRTAIIAPSDLAFGMARMYEVMTEQSAETVRVFREDDEAMAWLDGPTP